MQVTVEDQSLGEYLDRIEDEAPDQVRLEGYGNQLGKTAWLALVLETEKGYERDDLSLERVVKTGTRDVSKLTIRVERGDPGGVNESRDQATRA